jgi:hypothetical protein
MKNFGKIICAVTAVAVMMVSQRADAALLSFNATGFPGISGFVEFDDSGFDGTSFQFYSNSNITNLSMTVFGETFSFGDVVAADDTIIDSTGAIPVIVNGAGHLAINVNGYQIAFFPDDYNSSGSDGDASLAFGTNVFGTPGVDVEFYQVQWTVSEVPEPGTIIIWSAFAGMGLICGTRRRKIA